ncbi:MAG: DUF4832 domain-containing protein [Hamadaea sp.]|nr:DUF4832 domain-containing protein [Hamadaea sp.]
MSSLRKILATVTAATLTLALVTTGATAAPAGPPTRPPAGPGPDTTLTTHTYGYADAALGQPMKGIAPYLFPGDNLSTKYPGGLVWSYFALNEVMKDPANCATIDWSVFEKALDEAAVWSRQVAFRFYLEYPGGSGTHPGNGIPPCLNGKVALRTNGFWGTVSPDYDDPDLIAALTTFINAFAQRYDRAGPGGTADPRIGFMSLGLVGLWGEWHTWPYDRDLADGYPNLMPSDATIRTIIGAYDTAFDNIQLEVRYPLAGTETANIGFHDDSWPYKEFRGGQLKSMTLPVSMNGWEDAFLQLQLNTGTENRWVTQSIGGEARPEIQGTLYADWPNGSGQVDNVLAATELTHISWMINQTGAGGYSTTDPKVSAGMRKMGYNLHIPQANFNATASGSSMKVGVTIQNDGVAPFYYPWTVVLGLRDSAGNVVKTWDTSWDLRQVQPLRIRAFPDWNVGTDPTYLDFGRPVNFSTTVSTTGVPAGNYSLVLKVRNPLEAVTADVLRSRPAASRLTDWVIDQWRPRLPLSFANANQGADGWVNLGAVSTNACTGDCTAPSAPSGLAVSGVTNTSVSLSWSASSDNVGVTGYRVFRDGVQVGTPTGTTFTDAGRSPGSTYQYAVRAVDAAGNVSGPSGTVSATTSGCSGDCTPPSAPTLSSTGKTDTSVSLSWTAATDNVGVTGYEVFRGSTLVGSPTGTSFTDTGLTASTAYAYTVKARDAAGNRSAASNTVTVTTDSAPQPPVGLVLDNYDGTPAYPSSNQNDLGKWTGGNCFLDGGGSGVVSGGALSLRYNNCGWFGSDVGVDLSAYTYLVVRIKGAAGGEQNHFNLGLGGSTKLFGDFTLDGGAHPVITTAYQDIKIPMVANGINRNSPSQLAMGFWYGGTSTITIDHVTFQ